MSYEKIARLVKVLSNQTKDQELKWNETETEGIYEISFKNYSVRLSKNQKFNEIIQDFEPIIILELANQNGEIIEQITDENLGKLIHDPYGTMKEMYETARRQAMGVESALDEILSLIDPDVPF